MSVPSARGLLIPSLDAAPIADRFAWESSSGPPRIDGWPPAEYRLIESSWTVNSLPLVLVVDRWILRTYLWSRGPEGMELLHSLADNGVIHSPTALIAAAETCSDWWADQIETLNDLVAGCIDPRQTAVHRIWQARLNCEHPAVRLVASWLGPYLTGAVVRRALATRAAEDESPEVRAAAGNAMKVLGGLEATDP